MPIPTTCRSLLCRSCYSLQQCTFSAGSIDLKGVSQKTPAGEFTRCPLNLSSHNHNQHDSSPCFYLAVSVERSKSTPRYDISLRRNRAPHVSGPRIPMRTDRSPTRRSAAEPSRAHCKDCARPATRMTIGRHCASRPPHDLQTLVFVKSKHHSRQYDRHPRRPY
jgi:hypothetical protein